TRQGLLERLQCAALQPDCVVDLGAAHCAGTIALISRYPGARVLAIDHSANMLAGAVEPDIATVCAEASRLPLTDASVDLIFCNLMLACCRDPVPVLAEARRILAPRGLFAFATLGQESFRELRTAWAGLDNFVHLPPHPDMHSLGALLQQAGFVETVLDSDEISVTYKDFTGLAADLKATGSSNHSIRRNPGLTGRQSGHLLAESANRLRGADGRFAVTIQLIYGLAWAGTEQNTRPGQEINIPLSKLSRQPRAHG
ncbi:MAG TPA: methyltransferase domain-containing protein, partial [Chromatiales bacterium]|nr:methyltransferase domain-containing protein [Chromatiales bacterium]